MNAYAAVAAVLGFLAAAHIRATATVGGAHFTVPLVWLLVAGAVLFLAAVVLWIARDDGFWLTPQPAAGR